MYNELKTEIELEKEKLQKDMGRYLEIDTETDEILANIAEVAANVGVFLKSPILSTKKEILRLILSDCKIEGKNLCFSITKPFDKLQRPIPFTPEYRMFLSVPYSIGKSQHNPVTQRKKASRPSVPGSLYKFGLITAYLAVRSALRALAKARLLSSSIMRALTRPLKKPFIMIYTTP